MVPSLSAASPLSPSSHTTAALALRVSTASLSPLSHVQAAGIMSNPIHSSPMLTPPTTTLSFTPVNATSQSARVDEIDSLVSAASGAHPLLASSADSTKCLATSSLSAAAHAHPQAQACRDGGDNREKQISSSSPHPIASTSKAMLISSSSSTQSSHLHAHHSPTASPALVGHDSSMQPAASASSSIAAASSSSTSTQSLVATLALPTHLISPSTLSHSNSALPASAAAQASTHSPLTAPSISASSDDHPMNGAFFAQLHLSIDD